MSILGSTGIANGQVVASIDHDPEAVNTDVPKGSLLLKADDNRMWQKLTDGDNKDVAQIARIRSGTYVGDGTAGKAITGLGFKPRWLQIVDKETVDATLVDPFWTTEQIVTDNAAGGAIDHDADRFKTNRINSLDADGFTVDDNGTDAHPNKDGATYNYIAIG